MDSHHEDDRGKSPPPVAEDDKWLLRLPWATTHRRSPGIVADHGLPMTFHPHLGTFVESGWEISRLLETTTTGLTLDTGHALLAGVDPVRAIADWGSRIDHVHLKDVRAAVCRDARRAGPVPLRTWWSEANCGLGRGDVDLSGVLDSLARLEHRGWLVVEQDIAPHGGPQLAEFSRDQQENLRVLGELLDGR